MNQQKIIAACTLILAAITFWVAWFLMPDPGTTDTSHILRMVKISRIPVLVSVIVQIISSVLYIVALFLLAGILPKQKTSTVAGLILLGIGAMGLCADAFFHLLAFFMTDNRISIQQDVVQVMIFMQTTGVVFLIPLLLPLFIGSLVLAIGMKKQSVVSEKPAFIFVLAFCVGIIGAIVVNRIMGYQNQVVSLVSLGLFAIGQIWIAFELNRPKIIVVSK